MLKTCDLIKDVDEKYIDMLKMVNIPEFTKCMAQFSGIRMDRIPDDSIKYYLTKWAENKYKFFLFLGNSLRSDIPFEYDNPREDLEDDFEELSTLFPVYRPWLNGFISQKENKINIYSISYEVKRWIGKSFPNFTLGGSTMTHFFKKCLGAPDELVTKIAAIFENTKISAIHTISIDPVDIMTASETPYNWQSCYRLEADNNDDSHADGCAAALLDSSTLITYVWNNEGRYELYDNYELKNIRYKRMRQWISISPTMTSIHFNKVYPGKDTLKDELLKALRDIVETKVAAYIGRTNKWKRNGNCYCNRKYAYGYDEYSENWIWQLSDEEEPEKWTVFDERVKCLCCLEDLPGSYSCGSDDPQCDDDYSYNGDGFCCSNISMCEEFWCDYMDDYCSCRCCEENCQGCCHWEDAHPVCDLDREHMCDFPNNNDIEVDDGVAYSCEEDCSSCPFWRIHHPEEYETANSETETITISSANNNPSGLAIAPNDIAMTTTAINMPGEEFIERLNESIERLRGVEANEHRTLATYTYNPYARAALGIWDRNDTIG